MGGYDKVIQMFLQFGYMDERVISDEQLVNLYRLNV